MFCPVDLKKESGSWLNTSELEQPTIGQFVSSPSQSLPTWNPLSWLTPLQTLRSRLHSSGMFKQNLSASFQSTNGYRPRPQCSNGDFLADMDRHIRITNVCHIRKYAIFKSMCPGVTASTHSSAESEGNWGLSPSSTCMVWYGLVLIDKLGMRALPSQEGRTELFVVGRS